MIKVLEVRDYKFLLRSLLKLKNVKQYIDLLKTIQERGTVKQAAREGMPSTTSIFGYQFRHNLADGFPLLTTKKVNFKNIVTELIWFLNGDTNIKFLIDNGCNIWNEDAYNYYLKKAKYPVGTLDRFVQNVSNSLGTADDNNYVLGDCGNQYGKLWRDWKGFNEIRTFTGETYNRFYETKTIDQILELIGGLINNPLSRRHIVTAWNPATLDDMALHACHCMVQFNCRPLTHQQRTDFALKNDLHFKQDKGKDHRSVGIAKPILDEHDIPKYYLDCQMYQRSADAVLGVPYNIASYALLTEILAKVCNMVAGEYIHTFGDVHIYDNHKGAVKTQLQREPVELPTLNFDQNFYDHLNQWSVWSISEMISSLQIDWFTVDNYNPAPPIKAKLSTGLIK